jgi:hypothetical protein
MNEEFKPQGTPAIETPAQSQAKKRPSWLPVAVLVGVFLAGLVPMWLKSGRLNAELFRAQQQARVQQIQITLAGAALDARRGDYELARQALASFFTLANTELERGTGSALPIGASEGLKSILAQRDDLITLLARGDPASAERLAAVYAAFRKALAQKT